MKQTAVEWLIDKLYDMNIRVTDDGEHGLELYEAFKKAKAMEKEQIIKAHGNKQKTKSNPESIVTFGYTYTGEMYYNEEFKGIKPII
jgi:hypothetical protein